MRRCGLAAVAPDRVLVLALVRVLVLALVLTGALPPVSAGAGGATPDRPGPPPTLHLRTGAIDAATATDPGPLPSLAPDQRGLFVVQFRGAIGADARAALKAAGAEILHYVPDFAFLVRLEPRAVQGLRRHGLVQALTRYRPEWKISPDLQPNGEAEVLVVTAPAAAATVANAALGRGGIIRHAHADVVAARLDRAGVLALARREDVLYADAVRPLALANEMARQVINAEGTISPWQNGLTGAGQIVAVADTGLDTGNTGTLHPDLRDRLQVTPLTVASPGDWSDGHGHGTHVAGTILGNGNRSAGRQKGMAPDAKLVFQSIGPDGSLRVPANLGLLFGQAESYGAKLHNNSWGEMTSGAPYTPFSSQVDQYLWEHRDFAIVFAAGNEGSAGSTTVYNSISPPGTAKNAITAGASENDRANWGSLADNPDQVASFSSRGLTADGRIKPDVVAPGTWILSTRSALAPDRNFGSTAGSDYGFMSGTSMATPVITGAAALVRQYYADMAGLTPTSALIKATLINGARDMGYGWMSRDQGWGRIDLATSLYPTGGRMNWFAQEETGLGTGEATTYTLNAASGQILKITLVWTDYPAAPFAGKTLVNDLNLEVTAPDGTVYKGNCFAGNTASAGCTTFDRTNNVENVYVAAPVDGAYAVKITGSNVPYGPQPYAVVVSGVGVSPAGLGPAIRIAAPAGGAVLTGTVTAVAEATDADGIDRVEFYLDATDSVRHTATTGPYRWDWDTGTVADGAHNLIVRAYDTAGNLSSTALAVTVDNGAPTAGINSPTAGAGVRGLVPVRGSATDAISAVSRVEFYLDGTLMRTDYASPHGWVWHTGTATGGNHRLTASAYDAAGNVGTAAATAVAVDNAAPVVGITAPARWATITGPTPVTAAATDDVGISSVEFFLDGVRQATVTTGPDTWTLDPAAITGGYHTLAVRARDAAGNMGVAPGVTVFVDTPPDVRITAPTAGTLVRGTVPVTAAATDASSTSDPLGVTRVEFYLDDTLSATATTAPYAWNWDSTTATAGDHALTAKAYDGAGNVTRSAPVAVAVDNAAPAVRLTAPAAGTTVTGAVSVQADATDNRSVTRVELYVDGAPTPLATVTSSPYIWPWDTAAATVASGNHQLTVRAYDGAGNVTTSAPVTVTVDQPPTVAITAPKRDATVWDTVTVAAAAADDAGIARVDFYLDGETQPRSSATTSPYTWNWKTAGLTTGKHTLTARALDTAGNSASSAAVTVYVDSQAPAVVLEGVGDGDAVRGAVSLTARAADDRGISRVEFYLDGSPTPAATAIASPYVWRWNTAQSRDGRHTLQAVAYDTTGKATASGKLAVQVDNTAPSAVLTAPADGATLTEATLVSAQATDNSGVIQVEFSLDGARQATDTTSPYTWAWDPLAAGGGNHTLAARAYDAAGNATSSPPVAVFVDEPPDVRITSPGGGTVVRGAVAVTAAAADAATAAGRLGVTRVEFYLDGAPVGTATAAPYTWNWDTTAAVDGDHLLTARAYDGAGNVTPPAAVTVTVDNATPTVRLTNPTENATLTETVDVTADASDNRAVTRVEFYLNGASTPVATATSSPYVWRWDPIAAAVASGEHTLTARAYDEAGNATAAAPVTITVDKPSTVAITAPKSGATLRGTAAVQVTAADDIGVARVEIHLDGAGAPAATLASSPYVWDWDTAPVADGRHTLTARAYDDAGNAVASAPVAVITDNTAPTVTLTAPAAGSTLTGVTAVTARAADTVQVTRVEFFVDDVLQTTITAGTTPGTVGTTSDGLFTWNWDPLTAGRGGHTLTARAYDAADNAASSASVSVVVKPPPDVWITAPTPDTVVRGPVAVTVTAANPGAVDRVEFYLDGARAATVSTAPFTWSWDTTAAANGDHTLTARAYAADGDVTPVAAVPVTVDNAAPAIGLTAPTDGATLTGTVKVTAEATDNRGITRVEFYLDDAAKPVATAASGPYEWTWNTVAAAGGNHRLMARAYDEAGNVTPSSAVTVTVDKPPTVALTAPKARATVWDAVTLQVAVTDDAGVVRVEYYLDDKPLGTASASPFAWPWPTTTAANGRHTLVARAYDTAGNTATATAVAVTVDNEAPAVRLTAPGGDASGGAPGDEASGGAPLRGTVTIAAQATDNLGIGRVEFYLDGTLQATVTAGPYVWPWDTARVGDGRHTLHAVAYDTTGKAAESDPVAVNVDNTAPTARLTAPAAGATLTQVTLITAEATDNTGVTRVQFVLDGTVKATATTSPYTWTWDPFTAGGGDHTLTVRAYDGAGNAATDRAVEVFVDQPPDVRITAPAGSAVVRGQVAVAAAAADQVGVTRVEFDLDGTLAATVTTAPYTWNWDTTTGPNGDHALAARAYDDAGNVTPAAAVAVTVDNAAPAVSLQVAAAGTPGGGATDGGATDGGATDGGSTLTGTVDVTAAATDNLGVTRVEFFLDGDPVHTDTASPYGWSWDTTTTSGEHSLLARAYDAAGNAGTSAAVTVAVDHPPAVRISGPASGALVRGTVPVAATATDQVGVSRVEFALDGTLAATATAAPYTWTWDTTATPDGKHTLSATTYDTVGQATTTTVKVTVDNAAPVVSLAVPTDGARVLGAIIVVAEATDNQGVARVEFTLDGELAYTTRTGPYTWTWDTAATTVTGGSHTLAATAHDAAGNINTSAPITIAVNKVPTVAITAPGNGATVGDAVTVQATAADDKGVTRVEFFHGGEPNPIGTDTIGTDTSGNDTSSTFTWPWDTAGLATGFHTLWAKAYDTDGNITTAATVTIFIDHVPPTIAITRPGEGATIRGLVPVAVNASDNRGLSHVEYYVDGSPEPAATVGASPYTWEWDTSTLPDGSHTVQALASDQAGEIAPSAPINVNVDNTAPAVSLVDPAAGATVTGVTTVRAQVADNVAIDRLEFYLDGVLQTTRTGGAHDWTWDTAKTPAGQHTLMVRAYDQAGNVATSATVTVTVTP